MNYRCECGYVQDIEPTLENQIKYHGIHEANRCASCGEKDKFEVEK